ncbi:MAG: CoB--CoM heterodisulfide reductase iron-sulfur subunit A family protein [Dissulfurimicrobium sp.]|uniref:CoB--CoM heterodisulfide reductase iron-sulfur subunit A family protein n=1 Tax=Dissulfurimicrobium sp. TaxID=2022436 RepID=UPI00404A8389
MKIKDANKKIGVFICHCGGNISDYVDVEKVRETIAHEKGVVVSRTNMFSCSDAAQQEMIRAIKENSLDGLVIASCSPRLHLQTFRAMAERAGLNRYKYTQVNIREQCSWAHTHNKQAATEKAIRLVRSGIARTRLTMPLQDFRIETLPKVLIIGAGPAGLRCAIALANIGIQIYLVERSSEPGGMIRKWGKLFPNDKDGEETAMSLIEDAKKNRNITIFTNAEIKEKEGSIGNFTIKLDIKGKGSVSLNVGAIIVTTGFSTYIPGNGEFGYGAKGVITLPQYKELLQKAQNGLEYDGKRPRSIVYIYCVGSRQPAGDGRHTYCSRYCCASAIHTAICTHELDPEISQFHLYRDIRTYGKYELLYNRALKTGSLFLRYDPAEPPEVKKKDEGLLVSIKDRLTLNEKIEIDADLVVLVTGMEPAKDSRLAGILKIPVDKDGFFNEIHPKLRPVETVMDGIFIAGAAQGPKTLAESVISSMAAASKAAGLLLKGYVDIEPLVAKTDPGLCAWCGVCTAVCPYSAIEQAKSDSGKIARVNPALCKGCGACVPVCPRGAIDIEGYTDAQVKSMISALAREVK